MILDNPFKGEWGKLTSMRKEDGFAVLDIIPGEAEAIFSKITFWVSTQNWMIRKLALYEKSGDVTILSYENIRVNTGIPDSRFKVDLPADVEILQPTQ
jgi:outer membrane lipoprotein-sorting protein